MKRLFIQVSLVLSAILLLLAVGYYMGGILRWSGAL